MQITVGAEISLEFQPDPGIDFRPIKISMPAEFNDSAAESDFYQHVGRVVRRACSSMACASRISYASSGTIRGGQTRMIQGVTIQCNNQDCPLGGSGGAGDREPLEPLPEQPELEEKVVIPASV